MYIHVIHWTFKQFITQFYWSNLVNWSRGGAVSNKAITGWAAHSSKSTFYQRCLQLLYSSCLLCSQTLALPTPLLAFSFEWANRAAVNIYIDAVVLTSIIFWLSHHTHDYFCVMFYSNMSCFSCESFKINMKLL